MHLVSEDEAVPSEDSALYGIPDDELTVAILGEIKFIGIARLACPPAVEAEGFLTEAPYFLHGHRGGGGMEDIDLVASFVSLAQELIRGEFGSDLFLVLRGDERRGVHASRGACRSLLVAGS